MHSWMRHDTAGSHGVDGREVVGWHVVDELAHIALPTLAAVHECHEGVDVGAAAPAADLREHTPQIACV